MWLFMVLNKDKEPKNPSGLNCKKHFDSAINLPSIWLWYIETAWTGSSEGGDRGEEYATTTLKTDEHEYPIFLNAVTSALTVAYRNWVAIQIDESI